MTPESAAGSGLRVKAGTAASWGPQYSFDDVSMPTDYSLAGGGGGVRLGGEVADEYTGGRDFAADVSQRRSELAQQDASRFGASSLPSLFDGDRLLAGAAPQAGYRRADGGWVGEGNTGVQNIGSITSTRFPLDDLPAQYQSAYGPVKLARDAIGQGYLAVPIDDQGTTKFYSPPADYEVPSLATLQARQMGRGIVAGAAAAPGAALDVVEAFADFMDGAFNPNAKAQSPITQGIRDGRITGSSLLYGLVESSPAGWVTNIGIGTPESMYSAGQTVGGSAVFGAAGLTVSSGLRLSARVGMLEGPGTLYSYGDHLRPVLGPATLSHPDEVASILKQADGMGIGVRYEPGRLAYEPALRSGSPGTLILDPDASIGALRHEWRHALDNADLGHPGFRLMADSDAFWRLEYRGYMEEISLARQTRNFDVGRQIVGEMRARRGEILGY